MSRKLLHGFSARSLRKRRYLGGVPLRNGNGAGQKLGRAPVSVALAVASIEAIECRRAQRATTKRPFTFARRGSGVLMHLTSLPGPHGSGDLGPAAFAFAD